jgi:ABC-type Fe3+ transport system permease subunit
VTDARPASRLSRLAADRSLAIGLCVVTLLVVAGPAVLLAVHLAGMQSKATTGGVFDPMLADPPWLLLSRSAAWAAGVGLLSTLVAIPAAWHARGRPMAALAFMAPLALPSYFAYGALNLLRAPGSPLGDWLAGLVDQGFPDAPMLAGRVIAALSLTLWTWPLAMLAMLPAARGVSDDLLDHLAIDAPRGPARAFARLSLLGAAPCFAIALVGLVVLGSPVPLHVAQVPTAAMAVWIGLVQDPTNPRHWLAGWPLLVPVAIAGAWLAIRLRPRADAGEAPSMPRARRDTTIAAASWTIWAASIVAPMALLIWHLHEWASIPRFLRLHRDALAGSLTIAAITGLASGTIACLCWWIAPRAWRSDRWSRRAVAVAVAAWCCATLAPGVMLGAGFAHLARLEPFDRFADSIVVPVAAHVVRYASPCIVAVMLLLRAESRAASESVQLDGAETFRGFVAARLRAGAGPLVACMLLTASLSLHDIDTSILVQPPGDTMLAQHLLGYLHFWRTEELSAGSLILMAASLAAAGSAAMLMRGAATTVQPERRDDSTSR